MNCKSHAIHHVRFSIVFCVLLIAAAGVPTGGTQAKTNYVPPDGFVPNSETAIAVAKAVLTPVYGADVIRREEPFSADLDGDVWFVHGTLPKPGNRGGVAEVSISRSKGCILRMIHGK